MGKFCVTTKISTHRSYHSPYFVMSLFDLVLLKRQRYIFVKCFNNVIRSRKQ